MIVGVLLASRASSAQQTVDYASISGRVTDVSGAAVAGAQVEARQIETNLPTTTVSDGSGRFRLPYLRIGPYELVVSEPGFAPVTRRLTLGAGSAFEFPIVLRPEGVTAAVTVSADAARTRVGAQPDRDHRVGARRSGTCR